MRCAAAHGPCPLEMLPVNRSPFQLSLSAASPLLAGIPYDALAQTPTLQGVDNLIGKAWVSYWPPTDWGVMTAAAYDQ